VSQATQQLPAFENEDFGLLLYGLASLAQPLSPDTLARAASHAGRKLSGLSGEGLCLLVWGLAQYGYEPQTDAAADWWGRVFSEFSGPADRWAGVSLRGAGLLAVALGQLGPRHLPPGEWELAWVRRYRALVGPGGRPRSWQELLLGVRAAAGCEPDEQLPDSPWLCNLLLQLGKSWGLQEPAGAAAGLAAAIASINSQAAATAGAGATDAAAGGSWVVAGGQPTSATVVLL
jgi:hypothetical protein